MRSHSCESGITLSPGCLLLIDKISGGCRITSGKNGTDLFFPYLSTLPGKINLAIFFASKATNVGMTLIFPGLF